MRFAADSAGNTYLVKDDGSLEKITDPRKLPCSDVRQEIGKSKVVPGAMEMAGNLASAGKVWAKAGFKLIDKAEHTRRWEICRSCTELTAQKRCALCGCFMQLKSRLAGMVCPAGRW